MPVTFDDAFAAVQPLVADFHANRSHYLSPTYQESEVRTDFINKFFIALGWDMNHDRQKVPWEQEVKVEKSVPTGSSQRRADYAFHIAPNYRDARFFAEAKKPHGDIATKDNYFQTLRYGWYGQTPLAVLTDFEQFEILDCRYKPKIDTALTRSIRKFHYQDYTDKEKFAFIYHLFSRDAVANGSLEKFTETLPKLRGKSARRGSARGALESLDETFLADLDEYRDTLAHAFKNKNPDLNGDTLTEITQRTIDRLVFIRFLEDKLIHPENLVAHFGDRGSAWQNFVAASRKLDGIYNGIVFKRHDQLDAPTLQVDDVAFADICRKLSHVETRYDFDKIPIHILGSIYERFLGKIIVTTAKRVTVEEKPEVRKAGGVYYTPDYIVRYIVENTVGKLIADKTPAQIAELRFADIACGSGSFLLGVYDLLLLHHLKWFNANPDKAKKAGCNPLADGVWHLSLQQKRDILLNNIYGVDIDAQAVEVAQLSLYLKLLEEETTASARQYYLDFEQQALLPSLTKNIVCGNSLIGTDIISGELFDPVAERKLNPMDFAQRFPQIFRRRPPTYELRETTASPLDFDAPGMPLHGSFSYKKKKGEKAFTLPALPESEFEGGFDAIVGNPPYIRIQTIQESSPHSVEYFKNHYTAAAKGNYDIYVVFVEKALALLKPKGTIGYILPHKFLNAKYGEPIRERLAKGRNVSQIVHFSDEQVFDGATTYTCLLFAKKEPQTSCEFVSVEDLDEWQKTGVGLKAQIPSASFSPSEWNLSAAEGADLFKRLTLFPDKLGDAATLFVGLQTSADTVFLFKECKLSNCDLTKVSSKELGTEVSLETALLKPVIRSGEIGRYWAKPSALVLFPYGIQNGKAELIPESKLKKDYARAWAYLADNKSLLAGREHGKFANCGWHQLYPKNLDFWEQSKIMIPYMVTRLSAFYDTGGCYFVNVTTGGFGMTVRPDFGDLKYFTGLLNSKILDWFFKRVSTTFHGGYFAANKQFLVQLPIPALDLRKPSDRSRHDKLVSLVDRMLAGRRQLAAAQTERDKNFYENKCDGLDQQIDALVYELYGLTADEIRIVEGTR